MQRTLLIALAVGVSLLVVSRSVFAHHAGGAYDTKNPVTMKGTVKEFRFTNPHTQIVVDVKDAQGNVVTWTGVMGPPARMYRSGWRTNTVKPGDQVEITGPPVKDGGKVMGVSKLLGPDGKELGGGGE